MSTKATPPPPAYFLSLSLENVRSFGEKQTIHFTEGGKPDGKPAQWTIILGDNGVGKTTVLKSIVAMSPMPDPGSPDFSIPAYISRWPYQWAPTRHKGEEKTIISCEIGVGVSVDKAIKNFKPGVKWQSNLSIEKNQSGKFKRSGTVLFDDISSLICYGYGAGRSIGNSTLGSVQDIEDTSNSIFDDRADLLNPEEWFLQADYRIKSNDDRLTKQNFDLLSSTFIKVLSEVADIRVSPVAPDGDPQQGLQFKTPYGWIRLKDMSLGYQTLAVWLTDLASKLFIRYPDSKMPLAEPAVVLIDEIDLHLHPSLQRMLIDFLSTIFKKTQFIVTAHSPLVIQAADEQFGANVVLLKREGDQTVVYQNPEDVRGWRVDQILTSSFFNLDTARSIGTEKKLKRQAALLNKEKLTAKQRQELEALTLELEGQPMGSTGAKAEEEENELLRQIAARLGKDLSDLSAEQ